MNNLSKNNSRNAIIKKIEIPKEIKIRKERTANILQNPLTQNMEKSFKYFIDENYKKGTIIKNEIYENEELKDIEVINEYTKYSKFSDLGTIKQISTKETQYTNISEEETKITYHEILEGLKSDTEIIKIFKLIIGNPKVRISTNKNFKNFSDTQLKIFGKLFQYAQSQLTLKNESIEIDFKLFSENIGLKATKENKRQIFHDFEVLSNTEFYFEFTDKSGREHELFFSFFSITSGHKIDRIPQTIRIQFGDWFKFTQSKKELQTYRKQPEEYFFIPCSNKKNNTLRILNHITSLHRIRLFSNKKRNENKIEVSFSKMMEILGWNLEDFKKNITPKIETLEKELKKIKTENFIPYTWKKPKNQRKLFELYYNSKLIFDVSHLNKFYKEIQ